MQHILVMGAGKIGTLIAFLLAETGDYQVHLADTHKHESLLNKIEGVKHCQFVLLDAGDRDAIIKFIADNQIEAIISSLPFYFNAHIVKIAEETHIHYFDLTEDVKSAEHVRAISKNSDKAFVPQCGLAPGFISLIAHDLMKDFPTLNTVKLRVGALPQHVSNALQYNLTWSTDGLINEYGNPCHAIFDGKNVSVMPLQDLEEITIDGLQYEAFNTSGGIGSLVDTYANQVVNMTYKTIRYPGHCKKIQFLMNDLHLNQDRDLLKRIFEHAMPKTQQDVVIVYVSVNGLQHSQFVEKNYVRKYYPKEIRGQHWSAIQLTTASDICAVVDLVMTHPKKYHGFLKQEDISYDDFIKNRFGAYFA